MAEQERVPVEFLCVDEEAKVAAVQFPRHISPMGYIDVHFESIEGNKILPALLQPDKPYINADVPMREDGGFDPVNIQKYMKPYDFNCLTQIAREDEPRPDVVWEGSDWKGWGSDDVEETVEDDYTL